MSFNMFWSTISHPLFDSLAGWGSLCTGQSSCLAGEKDLNSKEKYGVEV